MYSLRFAFRRRPLYDRLPAMSHLDSRLIPWLVRKRKFALCVDRERINGARRNYPFISHARKSGWGKRVAEHSSNAVPATGAAEVRDGDEPSSGSADASAFIGPYPVDRFSAPGLFPSVA